MYEKMLNNQVVLIVEEMTEYCAKNEMPSTNKSKALDTYSSIGFQRN